MSQHSFHKPSLLSLDLPLQSSMGSVLRQTGPFDVKRIAIIGAGPTGLAAAKYLLAEHAFEKIDIFEQQAEVGGVWDYTPNPIESVPVPQTSPWAKPEKPLWPKGAAAPAFSNPMYEVLNTNIPKSLMQFSDLDFPSNALLYPTRQDVQKYLVKYSQDIRSLITFSTHVDDLSLSQEGRHDRWTLISSSTITEEKSHKEYDAVVVATGHYSVPWIPSVPGIEEFNKAYPAIISHSKIYRSPEGFAGKKCIVVGSAASGLDIGNQVSQVCQLPLLNSVHELSDDIKEGKKEEVPVIVEYLVKDRAVKFKDGRVENDVDAIIYCTGYLYSYPFLKSLDPAIVSTGRRVIGLWQQLFHILHPTLAFTALGQKIIPFPFAEAQGAAMAKVWSNKLSLLSTEEMQAWEKSRIDEVGEGTAFHVFGYPRDCDYINYLHDWVKGADDGFAKEPPFWGEEMRWIRDIYSDIKKKFVEAGSQAKTVEELGFDFSSRGR